jgi:hypothetical protein
LTTLPLPPIPFSEIRAIEDIREIGTNAREGRLDAVRHTMHAGHGSQTHQGDDKHHFDKICTLFARSSVPEKATQSGEKHFHGILVATGALVALCFYRWDRCLP